MDAHTQVTTATKKLQLFGTASEPRSGATGVERSMAGYSAFAWMLVPVVTLIDVSLARWFATSPLPGDIAKTIRLSEVYSNGAGVLFVVLAILALAPKQRWRVPRLATMAMGASACATITKMFVLRPRPNQLNLQFADANAAWLWRFDWKLEQAALLDSGTRAFPSADMATALALTVGLILIFPRGRYLFAGLAILTMLERMMGNAHFCSDVLGGVAIGLFWCFVCLHPRLLGIVFDPIETQAEERPMNVLQTALDRAA